MNEPLTKEKEIDTTAYNQDDFRRHPGFLSSDVRSAVTLLKRSVTKKIANDKYILSMIDFCFPTFKEEKEP